MTQPVRSDRLDPGVAAGADHHLAHRVARQPSERRLRAQEHGTAEAARSRAAEILSQRFADVSR
jgi:hypothetical protein